MRRANCMSLGMMVTLLAWMAHRLVSSKTSMRYASEASWSAKTALPWNLKSLLMFWAISRTSLWNGSFLIRRSVDFWYLRISLSATVPGRYRWGLLIPPCCGAAFLAAFFANAFLECPLFCRHFLAVCLVLTIVFLRFSYQKDVPFVKHFLGGDCFVLTIACFWIFVTMREEILPNSRFLFC